MIQGKCPLAGVRLPIRIWVGPFERVAVKDFVAAGYGCGCEVVKHGVDVVAGFSLEARKAMRLNWIS